MLVLLPFSLHIFKLNFYNINVRLNVKHGNIIPTQIKLIFIDTLIPFPTDIDFFTCFPKHELAFFFVKKCNFMSHIINNVQVPG